MINKSAVHGGGTPNCSNATKEHQQMYLQNKYTKWYYNIIANASLQVNDNNYREKHHIIPKSLGGNNEDSNLIKLTPKEHYICHLLLTKMIEGPNRHKMWYAHYMMMRGIKRYRPSARMYQLAKHNMIMANKERPGPNLGKPMDPETKEKISNSLKGKYTASKSEEHKQKLRKPKTEEHKQKLSEARKGKSYGYTHSDETKRKIAESNRGKTGKPKTDEQKTHQSEMIKGRKYSEEHRQKIADANRRRGPRSEETKQKIREARAKQVISEETKRKMSEAHKARRLNTI